MKTYHVVNDGWGTALEDFFNFNRLDYEKIDIWNSQESFFDCSKITVSQPCLLIIEHDSFNKIMQFDLSKKHFVDFCQQGHQVWIWSDADSFCFALTAQDHLFDLEKKIAPGVVTMFLDAVVSDRHRLRQLTSIKLVNWRLNWFVKHGPRIKHARIDKLDTAKDFLVTTIQKHNGAHRQLLWNHLSQRPHLIERGNVFYRRRSDQWIGDRPHLDSWGEGHASMDLYRNSLMEIAPETWHKHGYFITEKTIKPIATKTPFLMLSSCFYLKYLKSLGFKTFDSLIDESYDHQYRVQDRVRLAVSTLEDIVKNGTRNFYNAAQDIMEHNYARLCELQGRWQFDLDIMLQQELDLVAQKLQK